MIELEEAREALNNYTILLKKPSLRKMGQSTVVRARNPLGQAQTGASGQRSKRTFSSLQSQSQFGQPLKARQSVKLRPKPSELPI